VTITSNLLIIRFPNVIGYLLWFSDIAVVLWHIHIGLKTCPMQLLTRGTASVGVFMVLTSLYGCNEARI
jgi:hypothetical protein